MTGGRHRYCCQRRLRHLGRNSAQHQKRQPSSCEYRAAAPSPANKSYDGEGKSLKRGDSVAEAARWPPLAGPRGGGIVTVSMKSWQSPLIGSNRPSPRSIESRYMRITLSTDASIIAALTPSARLLIIEEIARRIGAEAAYQSRNVASWRRYRGGAAPLEHKSARNNPRQSGDSQRAEAAWHK